MNVPAMETSIPPPMVVPSKIPYGQPGYFKVGTKYRHVSKKTGWTNYYTIEKIFDVKAGDQMSCRSDPGSTMTDTIEIPSTKKWYEFWKSSEPVKETRTFTLLECGVSSDPDRSRMVNDGCYKSCFTPVDFPGTYLPYGEFTGEGRVFRADKDMKCYTFTDRTETEEGKQLTPVRRFRCGMNPF